MQEVFDPLSIEDLKEKKTLNGIKEDIEVGFKLKRMQQVKDRIANKKGRFPCKYCN